MDEYTEVVGTENIYSIGDSCILSSDPNFPNRHPWLAAVAKQQGVAMARNFIAFVKGEKKLPFKYKDKGTMAIIKFRMMNVE